VSLPSPTSEQAAIVAHPLGPLRIAAGAGTGKTASIVARLAAAIHGGLEPEQALGITFTNKAAEELADRLRAALPSLAAAGREVEVTTYHGFAHQLLQAQGALVGVERSAEVVGPGYVRQLLLQSLAGRDYHHLDLSAPIHRVADAAVLAGQLGDNLKTAADLEQACRGRDGQVWDERFELAGIIAGYERAKRTLGVLDYADLIRCAHLLVTRHPTVAAEVRARYRLVLLDEYQDTAPAQRELLLALFGGGFPVTAVGDADQTIYEWRGASLDNFAGFPRHFATPGGKEAPTLPLTVNHRADTRLLDFAHEVRRRLHGEAPFRRLVPRPGAGSGAVEARWFHDARAEALWIGEELRRLHDDVGVEWRRMAVLFRKRRHMSLVRDAMEAQGVPVEVASLGGLLEVPEVAELHAWLRILEHPDDAPALVRILLGSSHRLGLGDLAILAEHATTATRSAPECDAGRASLLETIDRLGEVPRLSAEARRRLEEFAARYRALLVVAQGVTLVELCRRILDAIDAWVEIDAMELARSTSARLNLYRFLDLAQQWSPLEGRTSLEAFLAYLDLLADETATDELDTARVGDDDAVTLLTVHRAKGLEWDTVFLPALTKGSFPAAGVRYDDPMAHARYLPYELRLDAATLAPLTGTNQDREQLRRRHEAAEWRTAYVAVTRARRRLYLTGAWWYGDATPRPPSELYDVARSCRAVAHPVDVPEAGERPERLVIETVEGAPDPLFPSGWPQAVRHTIADPEWPRRRAGDAAAAYDARVDQLRLEIADLPPRLDPPSQAEPFTTSVTGLVTLASCPKRFYWSEVDRLPRRPAPWLRRGVDVHRRIELHHRGTVGFDELDEGTYDLTPSESTAGDVTSAMAAFRSSRFARERPRYVEAPIDLRLGNGRLRGRVDAVYEPQPGTWEIVDFKTGQPNQDPARVVQLEAYAVAAGSGAVADPPPDDLTVTFAFLGGGQVQEVSHAVDGAWLDGAQRHLGELMAQAQGATFLATPSSACERCDFLAFCEEGRAMLTDR
jgi:DNA helicase-2/ATP-dependent DNA helicase PcrA